MTHDELIRLRNVIANVRSFEDNSKNSEYFKGWNDCWHTIRITFNCEFDEYENYKIKSNE